MDLATMKVCKTSFDFCPGIVFETLKYSLYVISNLPLFLFILNQNWICCGKIGKVPMIKYLKSFIHILRNLINRSFS